MVVASKAEDVGLVTSVLIDVPDRRAYKVQRQRGCCRQQQRY